MDRKPTGQWVWSVFFLLFVTLIALIAYAIQQSNKRWDEIRQTRQTCTAVAKYYLNTPEEVPCKERDFWGQTILVNRLQDKDGIIVAAISAGPDKEYGTDDDVRVIKSNLKYSKIIGRYLGRMTFNGLTGFKEGYLQEKHLEK